eukprot:2185152-Amphidinium_carterae.1
MQWSLKDTIAEWWDRSNVWLPPEVHHVAFMDDLVLLADTPKNLTTAFHQVRAALQQTGMTLNDAKS